MYLHMYIQHRRTYQRFIIEFKSYAFTNNFNITINAPSSSSVHEYKFVDEGRFGLVVIVKYVARRPYRSNNMTSTTKQRPLRSIFLIRNLIFPNYHFGSVLLSGSPPRLFFIRFAFVCFLPPSYPFICPFFSSTSSFFSGSRSGVLSVRGRPFNCARNDSARLENK